MLAFILASGLTGALQAFAQVDPNDEQSVRMGAQLYDLYCSDCHGVDASGRYGELYDTDDADSDVSEDYAELVELVRGAGAPEPVAAPQADWPEWADNPAPEAEEDVRAEVLGTVTGAIDRMHEAVEDSDPVGAWDDEDAYTNFGGFDPVPGATNLADPTAFFHGTSAEEMFDSIANGTGAAMPGWRTELGSDDAIWDLVNYIRSLWGEEWQF